MASILLSRSLQALRLSEPVGLRALSTTPAALKAGRLKKAKADSSADAPSPLKAGRPKKPKADPTADLPSPPKRPNSPFTRFFKTFYAAEKHTFIDSAGKTKVSDVARAAGKAWAALPEAEKKEHEAASKAEYTAYAAAMTRYLDTLQPAERAALEKKAGRKFQTPGGKHVAKLAIRERAGNPGRASSPFFEYLKAQRDVIQVEHAGELEGLTPMQTNLKVVSLAAQKWHTLTADESQKWKDECARKRQAYKDWVETQPDKGKLLGPK
ncbi:hypothetical protein Q8F55_002621 [Vanrija albida]|uniref:HMG box domain-containing protein n=1 Tax=Vanrija albida TaxID=181172 RepID=A0ABR3QAB1_9TREE